MLRKRVLLPFLLGVFLITSGLSIYSLNFLQLNQDNSENYDNMVPKPAYKPGDTSLSHDDIILNGSGSIFQYFEWINITVDTSIFDGDANYTFVELSDLDQNVERYNMTYIGSKYFSFNYSTSLNSSSQLLGFISVVFSVYDETDFLLNNRLTRENFTIKPNIVVKFWPDPIYHKGDSLFATLTPDYYSKTLYGWNLWNVSIDKDVVKPDNLFSIPGYNQSEISFSINASFDEFKNDYYVHVNLINSTDDIFTTSYYNFTVENTNPEIIPSSVTLSSTSIFRSDVDNCHIELNVTDLEKLPIDLNVTMELELSISDSIPYGLLDNNGDGSFQYDFSVDYDKSIGNYWIKLTINDFDGGITEYIHGTPLEVKNNAPEIHDYQINGISITQGISIYNSESITFTFNVSDVDGTVTDITVILINSNNERIERKVGTDSTIFFNSNELVTGTWYVYVYIEDSDGTVVSLTDDYDLAPQSITIIADVLSAVLPWIALVIGLIVGVLIGVGIGYYWIKNKVLDGQDMPSKKKPLTQKRGIPAKQKGKGSSKPSASEVKKKTEDVKEESVKSDKEVPQRKIKRKL